VEEILAETIQPPIQPPIQPIRQRGRPAGRKARGTRRCGVCSASAPSRKAVNNLTKVSKELSNKKDLDPRKWYRKMP
jgi:hypothetical protein